MISIIKQGSPHHPESVIENSQHRYCMQLIGPNPRWVSLSVWLEGAGIPGVPAPRPHLETGGGGGRLVEPAWPSLPRPGTAATPATQAAASPTSCHTYH